MSAFVSSRFNKKILMRERKRHTTRRVATARSAVLFRGEGILQSWVGAGGGGCTPNLACENITSRHTTYAGGN